MSGGLPFLGVSHSLTGRAWRARLADERAALTLCQQFGLPDMLGRVLAARGVTPERAEAHLSPSLRTDLPDPATFKDMTRAADLLAEAVMAGETVAVFGDYDVDGATSSALLKRFFRAAGADILTYIPDRLKEGYGPNEPALKALYDQGVRLVVTVDCGTLSYKPLAAARAMGLRVIVVDHHLAEPELPACEALVNPNRLDEADEHRHLAAVGVTFLLVVALNRALRERGWYGAARPEPNLTQWLDIVALGTVCDVVSLTGLNRTFVTQGLKVMAQRRNAGIRALADVAGLKEMPAAYHLGFLLGPRVNAGGRVGQADLGVRLLTTDDPAEAMHIAARLDHFNRERQTIESMVLEEAMAEAVRIPEGAPLILVAREGWHAGVIGIVAGRLKERFHKPSVVIGIEGGVGKGSCRSVPGVDIGAAVTAASQAGILVNGGGHPMAAGLTVEAGRLDELRDFLALRLAEPMALRNGAGSLGIDGALTITGCTEDLLARVAQAGPFGQGNAEPRFAIANAGIVKADLVGQDHVRVILTGPEGGRLKAVAFRSLETDLGRTLLTGRGRFHVAGSLKLNHWNGTTSVEMTIHDAAIA